MSRFEASAAINCLMAHNSVQVSYRDFLLPGHAATPTFESDPISEELCDIAFDNLTERIGTFDYIDCDDFSQLSNSGDRLSILHLNIRFLLVNFDKLENMLTSTPLQPDIIGLYETRIKSKSLINIDLPGYRFVHVDSLSNAGVSSSLHFQ